MFRCQECGKNSNEGETPFKKLLETRQKNYQHKEIDRRGRERLVKESFGWEIAKEISVCANCIGDDYSLPSRAAEKQASRDEDQRRLDAGEISREELREENSVFGKVAKTAKMRLDKGRLY